ncbi:8-amino-7-oxononanoate synthase [Polynucleobacter sp. SHI8]|uniref:aminotransferase class I/II-fold pyridoxal phosphate-dependent enzyme n=1 Tax=unclassified Polynucleobacter TaxID=2640945 RepID=UPI0024901D1C|nr:MULTISPECIES: 8-amino-7-oxononanoate synthase [unclassified Polynucleobacter]BDW10049.1 8-amino-7-oxononanoate synthase [Polynucleobacter sp. SHI2]BDW12495.1 8-amino-7-oxononanoate synthase [Polynucleobacter sp. SHI8]
MIDSWLEALDQANHHLHSQGLIRNLKLRSSPNGPFVDINGSHLLSFASNDYLGLSNHPVLKQAMAEGADIYGTGSGASALISGHSTAHQLLEEKLAQTQALHIPNVVTCFINTGFMANMAMITALASLGNISIYSDALNHASIIDGIRMAKAQSQAKVFVYPHNDIEALQALLNQDSCPYKLIITDSVFSMDGDFAPIQELVKIAEQHHALLYLDDAHGFGIFGKNGHGCLEHFDIFSPNIIYMGTLGKAVGVSGAFIAAQKCWIEWLIQKSRPVIYSTSTSPAIAHTVLKSIELIQSEKGLKKRAHLFELISYWNKKLNFTKWHVLPSSSAIQALIIGDNNEVMEVSKSLNHLSIWVPAIRPPTVPEGTSRLRITFNADHSFAHIDLLIEALSKMESN